jgi:hypothetical protein
VGRVQEIEPLGKAKGGMRDEALRGCVCVCLFWSARHDASPPPPRS